MGYTKKEKQKEYQRQHYQRNKKAYYDRHRQTVERNTRIMREAKDRPCMDCGQQHPHYVMQFDHRNPTDKKFGCQGMRVCGLPTLYRELAKCDVICANCHSKRTHQQRQRWKGKDYAFPDSTNADGTDANSPPPC